eukprot:PITA_05468
MSQQGLKVDPNKIALIQRVPPPQKQRDVRSFLGLDGYYRRLVKDFNKLASPLFGLLAKEFDFVWSKCCQEALDTLKDKLTTPPIFRGPNWALPFHIHVDASHKAIGAALGWIDEKFPYSIFFISKNMSKAELSYTMTKKELLDVVHSLKKSRHYITGEEGMVDDQLRDKHLFAISILSTWFDNIENYLVSTQFPPNLSSKEKSKIVRESTPFPWIGGNLLKISTDQILRRCVREEEVFDILLTCHDGPCGGHFTANRTTFKVLEAGYYWPTLH